MSERENSPHILVWLRNDLRLADNPALSAAIEAAGSGGSVTVAYILEEGGDLDVSARPLGAAARWWLHHSLDRLGASLRERGLELVLRRGDPFRTITDLMQETGATAVYWNRRYTNARQTDSTIMASLRETGRETGVEALSFHANYLNEPWAVQTGQGTPFRVFTPYWRACLALPEPRHPLPEPNWPATSQQQAQPQTLHSDDLASWNLLPTSPDWSGGLTASWQPGEAGAHEVLHQFITEGLANYHLRDNPAEPATSKLSPHLRFGEISPFHVWDAVRQARATSGSPQLATNAARFLSEVGWREFNASILFHFPGLTTRNVRPEFDAFPWSEPDPGLLEAWRRGRTGIPIIDAGMRELWHTGTMHNRVRMIVASFLVKNLLVDWRVGESWFWDTLVDADEASNPGNWQWVAGSGLDAAPYFRVFNPELQAQKFDPDGEYVRRWVPEVGTAGYPGPIVDLRETRAAALDAYSAMRSASGQS